MFYLEDVRETITKENAGASLGHISKLASDMWIKLPEPEKARYTQKSTEDKERYAKERDAFSGESPPHYDLAMGESLKADFGQYKE